MPSRQGCAHSQERTSGCAPGCWSWRRRCGPSAAEVDALVVETGEGDQVFTLKGADQTYRLMVEEMQKGAATLSDDGSCSTATVPGALLDVPGKRCSRVSLAFWTSSAVSMDALLHAAERGVSRARFGSAGRRLVPTQVSVTLLRSQARTSSA